MINPFSNVLTFFTSSTYFSIVRLQWIIPIPPLKANSIAIACSVTVSIGELQIGAFNYMFLEILVFKAISSTEKLINPGNKIKSS